ncbi:ribonuclease D [Marinicellulosiphila megalodicopiae]|uniref:ribonuclease D n=1 Tax=Marinicellulosiphila megalodicopiae TaxID=2724896 RepID=UPI003BAE3BE4
MSNNPNYLYISDQSTLESYIESWSTEPFLFVDTEFIRTQTFYPILALVQIQAKGQTFLIDPKTIEDMSCLKPLFTNPNVVKVLHALSEDIEVFMAELDVFVTPVLDTQVAAKWLNIGESIGYAKLIEHGLDVVLPKDQTQSDWLQRPLTDKQKQYAADDVIYLEQIFAQLHQALKDKDFFDVTLEDSTRLASNMLGKPSDQYYLKVKRAWKLPAANQYVLKQLCTWREELAKSENVPRTRVFNDVALVQIAERLPQSKHDLTNIVDVHPKQIRKYAQLAVDCVKEQVTALAQQSSLPEFDLIEPGLNSKAQGELKKMKQAIGVKAEQLGIFADCLCNKKHLESFYRRYVLNQPSLNYDETYFGGFRQQLLQPVLLEFLNHE